MNNPLRLNLISIIVIVIAWLSSFGSFNKRLAPGTERWRFFVTLRSHRNRIVFVA
jgi:hypothetical protein